MRIYLILLTIILTYSNISFGKAYLRSDFDMNWGVGAIDIKAGKTFSRTMESPSIFQLNYNLNVDGPNLAAIFSITEFLSSTLGTLPYTRLAFGAKWYVLGLNGRRVIYDNQVQGRLYKPAPFIEMTLGISSLAVDAGSDGEFNAALYDIALSAGVEIPIAATWLLIGKFNYLLAIPAAGGENTQALDYSGILMFAGVKTNFF